MASGAETAVAGTHAPSSSPVSHCLRSARTLAAAVASARMTQPTEPATGDRTMAQLLDPNTPRSERDPEASAAQDDCFARHPLTGAFTEPAVESAYAVGIFREAFPLHALLLAAAVMIYLFPLFEIATWRDDVPLLILA